MDKLRKRPAHLESGPHPSSLICTTGVVKVPSSSMAFLEKSLGCYLCCSGQDAACGPQRLVERKPLRHLQKLISAHDQPPQRIPGALQQDLDGVAVRCYVRSRVEAREGGQKLVCNIPYPPPFQGVPCIRMFGNFSGEPGMIKYHPLHFWSYKEINILNVTVPREA